MLTTEVNHVKLRFHRESDGIFFHYKERMKKIKKYVDRQ